MHVTSVGAAVGAVIGGLMLADVLYHWRGANALAGTGTRFLGRESGYLAGRG